MSGYAGSTTDAIIPQCPHNGCNFRCCKFDHGNYILMYPGELAAAERAAASLSHLHIVPDAAGGHKAVCRAEDTSSCDNGYKPLDCASYPFFPIVDADLRLATSETLVGTKCPLPTAQLKQHASWVLAQWAKVCRSAEVLSWLGSARLVGYHLWAMEFTSERSADT